MLIAKHRSKSEITKKFDTLSIDEVVKLYSLDSTLCKANYARIAKAYLVYLVDKDLEVSRFTVDAYRLNKARSIRSALNQFYKFCQKNQIKKPYPNFGSQSKAISENELFLRYITDIKNVYGKKTKTVLLNALNSFERYRIIDNKSFNSHTVSSYVNYLIKDLLLSPYTVNLYLSAIRGLVKWMLNHPRKAIPDMLIKGELPEEIEYALKDILFIKSVKKPDGHSRDELSITQRDKFYENISSTNKELKVYISLIIHCCMRISEPLSVRYQDIDFNKRMISIRQKGKVGRRQVYMFDQTFTALNEHIVEAGINDGPIFKELNPRKVRNYINKQLIEMELKTDKMVAHSLRHTGAQAMLKAGYSEYQVQRQLGHSDLKTTRIYTSKELERNYVENKRRSV